MISVLFDAAFPDPKTPAAINNKTESKGFLEVLMSGFQIKTLLRYEYFTYYKYEIYQRNSLKDEN